MAKKDNIQENENQLPKGEFLFESVNYKLLLVGIGVIALGFILMAGGEGSVAPGKWDDSIFSVRRIRVAPTVV